MGTRIRATRDEIPHFDIRSWKRDKRLVDGAMILAHGDKTCANVTWNGLEGEVFISSSYLLRPQNVKIVPNTLSTGATLHYFRCHCGSRACFLFLMRGKIGCRACVKVAYRSRYAHFPETLFESHRRLLNLVKKGLGSNRSVKEYNNRVARLKVVEAKLMVYLHARFPYHPSV